jgi:DNA end-binding protein Ku
VAARAIWKGVIRFADVELPVKLYSAVEDRTVHFNLLDRDAGSRVKQRMVVPSSGDPVPREEIRKGFETRPGEFVVLSDEEVEELSPEASRDIEITRFVPEAEVDHTWYDRPYSLGPDDSGGDDVGRDYFALAEALAKRGREGVARWVMRNKEYVGALRAEGDHLALITLRHPGEVIPADALSPPGGRKLDAKELDMAEQLVDALADDFEPESYADDYRERVMELLEAKAGGETIEVKAPEPEKEESDDLAGALEASLAGLKKGKSGG